MKCRLYFEGRNYFDTRRDGVYKRELLGRDTSRDWVYKHELLCPDTSRDWVYKRELLGRDHLYRNISAWKQSTPECELRIPPQS